MKKKQFIALILLAMKITIVQITLAVVFTCSVYAHKAVGQAVVNQAVTISAENIKIRKLISSIQQQTGVRFLYSPNAIKKRAPHQPRRQCQTAGPAHGRNIQASRHRL